MQKLLVAALLLFHAGCAGSSKLSPGDGVPVKEIVSLNDIEVLVKSGVPDDVIIRRIQSGRTLFVLSDEAVLDLKSAGVSENIIACIKSKLSAYEHQAEIRSEPPPEPQSHSGLRLSEARQKSLRLEPGMSQDAVRALLGDPDETSAGTYGTNTGHPWQVLNINTGGSNTVQTLNGGNTGQPWQGVAWTYRWIQDGSIAVLRIVFQHDDTSWDVNSWNWY